MTETKQELIENFKNDLIQKGAAQIRGLGKAQLITTKRKRRIKLDGANAGFKMTDEIVEVEEIHFTLSDPLKREVKAKRNKLN